METTTSQPSRRPGRPLLRSEPATAFDAWARRMEYTAPRIATRLREAAPVLGLPESIVPSVKTIGDLRVGRYKPSLAVTLLIAVATAGEVTLEHWVREQLARGDLG